MSFTSDVSMPPAESSARSAPGRHVSMPGRTLGSPSRQIPFQCSVRSRRRCTPLMLRRSRFNAMNEPVFQFPPRPPHTQVPFQYPECHPPVCPRQDFELSPPLLRFNALLIPWMLTQTSPSFNAPEGDRISRQVSMPVLAASKAGTRSFQCPRYQLPVRCFNAFGVPRTRFQCLTAHRERGLGFNARTHP